MSDDLKIVRTADGSNTIYNANVGENYHSTHGSLQESRHVFVNSGLQHFLDGTGSNSVSILEVGFGTGFNFLLSADLCATKGIALDYAGIEAYPLSAQMISQTNYDKYISESLWNKFNEHYGELLQTAVKLSPQCTLQIADCKLMDFTSEAQFDVIYFDAFASARQPEMWNEEAIAHTIKFLKPRGLFVTYAITGNLKRSLKSERLPGGKIARRIRKKGDVAGGENCLNRDLWDLWIPPIGNRKIYFRPRG